MNNNKPNKRLREVTIRVNEDELQPFKPINRLLKVD